MNTARFPATVLPLILITVLAAPALADAETPAPSEGAEIDPDISQIHGQLVPVGKHNEYRYSYPRTNVSTNPIGLLMGFYSLSLSHARTDHVVLRGDGWYYEGDDYSGSAYQVSFNAPIYFRRAYQGFFIEPGVTLRENGSDAYFGPHVLAGWHWRWDSGLNTAFAFGVGRKLGESNDAFGERSFGAGYWYVGYAF
jgi:hypothetical protein